MNNTVTKTKEPKEFDTIRTSDLYKYRNIKNFFVEEYSLEEQTERIKFCKDFFYYSFTCYNPHVMELVKMPDSIINRSGKLSLLMYLVDNNKLTAKESKLLENILDNINDDYDGCYIHNKAINEEEGH